MVEKIVNQPAIGDVLSTTMVLLTPAQISDLLDILAAAYPAAISVGYDDTTKTFFTTAVVA